MRQLRNRIEYGDRIFARLSMGPHTVVELILDKIADFTELITELRRATRGIRGLATLHIRNQSKGWSDMRPLMLYSQPSSTPAGGYGTASTIGGYGTASPKYTNSLFEPEMPVHPVVHQRYI